jgi:hypothetical protein
VRLLQVVGHLLQVVGCIRGGGGHFLPENGRLRLDPNPGKVFHNLAENSKISTGPSADPSKKRVLYKSHDVASNVGGNVLHARRGRRGRHATWVGDVATRRAVRRAMRREAMQRGARCGRRLHRSMWTPAPGTGTQDWAERLKNLVMLVMLKRTCHLSTSSPKSLESSEITARWCLKIWASISTTFLSAKKETFSTWCPVQGLVLRSLRRLARL